MIRKPDFLCIGAQRSGTSWLENSLKHHHEIWTPPIKELHYFDCTQRGTIGHDKRWQRYWIHLRYRFLKTGADIIHLRYHPKNTFWDIKYFLSPKRGLDGWYFSLFSDAKDNQICGEITPAYAILPEVTIKHIADLFPDLKIIFIMRNPIERTWSAIALHYQLRKEKLDQISLDQLYKDIGMPHISGRSDFRTTITKWEKYFPKEQIFYGYFDEIKENPQGLLKHICNFLEVNNDKSIVENIISKPINSMPGSKVSMPKEIREELTNLYIDQLKWLAQRFPESKYPQQWLNEALNSNI